MAKHDYTALDGAILASLKKGPVLFSSLCLDVSKEIKKIKAISAAEQVTPAWRIERRLQALRKAGLIRYQRKPEGWVLVDGAVREVAGA